MKVARFLWSDLNALFQWVNFREVIHMRRFI